MDDLLFKAENEFQAGGLKFILPHHTFYGLIGLTAVFRVLFLIILHFYFAIYRKINQLSDRHAFINTDRLFDRNFEGPVTAKSNIPFSSSCMNIDAQPASG